MDLATAYDLEQRGAPIPQDVTEAWTDEAREASIEARQATSHSSPAKTEQAAVKSSVSPDAKKYPHLAHMMNGTKVHSSGHSKTEARNQATSMRNNGIYASVMKDEKSPRGKQYLVLVPMNAKQSEKADIKREKLQTAAQDKARELKLKETLLRTKKMNMGISRQ